MDVASIGIKLTMEVCHGLVKLHPKIYKFTKSSGIWGYFPIDFQFFTLPPFFGNDVFQTDLDRAEVVVVNITQTVASGQWRWFLESRLTMQNLKTVVRFSVLVMTFMRGGWY